MFPIRKYRDESASALINAQRNLATRTHYVDDDTLRFHKSRILSTYITDDGLLFALIESVGLEFGNTRRGFRYVVFDVLGSVVGRRDLEDAFSTQAMARKAMWAFLNAIDAKALTLDAIERERQNFAAEMSEIEDACRPADAGGYPGDHYHLPAAEREMYGLPPVGEG
ncbi:MAG: hypothetical protein KGL39_40805 [Patescibacteria group bacterium]|nr:hypothetical protein [Patescibacteria group bacterium]